MRRAPLKKTAVFRRKKRQLHRKPLELCSKLLANARLLAVEDLDQPTPGEAFVPRTIAVPERRLWSRPVGGLIPKPLPASLPSAMARNAAGETTDSEQED